MSGFLVYPPFRDNNILADNISFWEGLAYFSKTMLKHMFYCKYNVFEICKSMHSDFIYIRLHFTHHPDFL